MNCSLTSVNKWMYFGSDEARYLQKVTFVQWKVKSLPPECSTKSQQMEILKYKYLKLCLKHST